MTQTTFFLTSSLEKVFPLIQPSCLSAPVLPLWPGTRGAVQLVCYADGSGAPPWHVAVEGAPGAAELLAVSLVPSDFPSWESARGDDNYLTHDPGLFPDLLTPLAEDLVQPVPRQYRSVWISLRVPEDAAPGDYAAAVVLRSAEEQPEERRLPFTLRVGRAQLLPQSLIHTEWFHGDCLADYYGVAPLSEAHWHIMERFADAAGCRHGINMLLTPVFTPPLDTAVGAERPTMQLVEIVREGGAYRFGFDQLRRWTEMCHRCGIEYLEIAHLFTQWGAKATPKIIAEVDGERKRIFGWDVPATSPEYRTFLAAFLPALRDFLTEQGYDREHVYFHISDEPNEQNLDSYLAARRQVEDLLAGCPIIDALSSYAFYECGAVTRPIPSNDHIEAFREHGVPDLWTYYCCCQGMDVPNRFFAMPSARNRIMGTLMYWYGVKGFLQWGYDFYYSHLSKRLIDPFFVTHADFAFPSGDAFLVYPGPDGAPYTSLRAEVQSEGLTDLRALQTLEKRIGAAQTRALVARVTGMQEMTFKQYPQAAETLLQLREAVFAALEAELA